MLTTRKIAENAIVAALYFVLTIVSAPIAYGQIQFRIAEALMLLCFFRKDFVIGLTVGCFLANLGSTLLPWDLIFGTLATLLAGLAIAFLSPRLILAALYPALFNAFIVGAELYYILELPFWLNVGYVALAEIVVLTGGYLLFLLLSRNKGFMDVLRAEPSRRALRW